MAPQETSSVTKDHNCNKAFETLLAKYGVTHKVAAVCHPILSKIFHTIYYANKKLNESQVNYTSIEKELLTVVHVVDKFRSYLMGTQVIIHTNDSVLKYLMLKEVKPMLI